MSEIDLAAIERGKEEAARRDGLRKAGIRDRVSGTKPEEGIPLDPRHRKPSVALVKRPEAPEVEPLTTGEAKALTGCESIIERHAEAFVEVGKALVTIRDRRLYRATHATFEGYCQERWDMGRREANRTISAAKVKQLVGAITPIPNVGVARELEGLLDQPKVLEKVAKKLAAAPKVTAKVAREIVQEIVPGAKPVPSEPGSDQDVWDVVNGAIEDLRWALHEFQDRGLKVKPIKPFINKIKAGLPAPRKPGKPKVKKGAR